MNGAVMNMVCYECGLFSNVVRYERGLLWTWSVMNVVCYERVCYEQVCYERDLFWKGTGSNIYIYAGTGEKKPA